MNFICQNFPLRPILCPIKIYNSESIQFYSISNLLYVIPMDNYIGKLSVVVMM